jgi:hypothetical protein
VLSREVEEGGDRVKVTTLRLPDDLDARLSEYCQAVGAVRNRVAVLALQSWLDDDPPPRVHVQPPAGDDPLDELRQLYVDAVAREADR